MSSPITVTLTFNAPKEVADFFATGAVQRVTGAAPQPAVSVTSKIEKPAKENPTKVVQKQGNDIDRTTVSKAAVALAIKDKAKAVAILAEHDVKAVKDLPDDQLGAVHAKLVAAMGE